MLHIGLYLYIGIVNACMYKVHYKSTSFMTVREAQSVEHRPTNLKDVGSSSTVGKTFHFVFSRIRRAPFRSTAGPNTMNSSMTFTRYNMCIERIII